MFINTPSVYKQISPNPFPNFPLSRKTPAQMGQHELGNWEIGKWLEVQISQFPKRSQPIWLSTIWEIGKFGNGWRYRFPNFPSSQKTPAQMGQHDLRNWEIGKWLEVQISQFPKRSQPIWLSTIWEIGKWLQVHTSQFLNFPNNPSPDGPARFGKLGNWEA